MADRFPCIGADSTKAYKKAQEALKQYEGMTFSDAEIEALLPSELRRGSNPGKRGRLTLERFIPSPLCRGHAVRGTRSALGLLSDSSR